jgi:hypothetical protein
MEKAIQKASVEAAASNAALPSESNAEKGGHKISSSHRIPDKPDPGINVGDRRMLYRAPSFESIDSMSTVESFDSINGGFTFQSRSKRIPRRSSRRGRQSQSKRQAYMLRMAAASLSFMIGRYLLDTEFEFEEESMESVLGFLGMFQTLILLLGLIKMQKYVRTKGANSDKCPVMRATSQVLKTFDNKKTSPMPDIIGGG